MRFGQEKKDGMFWESTGMARKGESRPAPHPSRTSELASSNPGSRSTLPNRHVQIGQISSFSSAKPIRNLERSTWFSGGSEWRQGSMPPLQKSCRKRPADSDPDGEPPVKKFGRLHIGTFPLLSKREQYICID